MMEKRNLFIIVTIILLICFNLFTVFVIYPHYTVQESITAGVVGSASAGVSITKSNIIVENIPSQTVRGRVVFDLNDYFYDPDKGELLFSAESSENVRVNVDGSIAEIVVLNSGEGGVTLYAEKSDQKVSTYVELELVEKKSWFDLIFGLF